MDTTTHPRNAGGLNASADMYLLSGIRGPFTPSQWLELEQQALIYKYITANEPIPVQLLIPIINAFNSAAGFNVFNGGWGPFQLGYSSTGATELGRCRRTDGKKWRCAKDAVANHKYCEKHIKRRSRKHVEGQGSDPVSRATKSTTTTKLMQPTPLGIPGDGSTTSFNINLNHAHQEVSSLHSSATNPNMDAHVNRMHVKRDDNVEGLQELSFLSHAANLDCSETSFKHSLHTFTDWSNSADQLSNLCPGLQSHSPYDSTQLSNVSMSTTSSPTNEHLSLRQANWMSISPEASMGGPLGEALQISNSAGESRENIS